MTAKPVLGVETELLRHNTGCPHQTFSQWRNRSAVELIPSCPPYSEHSHSIFIGGGGFSTYPGVKRSDRSVCWSKAHEIIRNLTRVLHVPLDVNRGLVFTCIPATSANFKPVVKVFQDQNHGDGAPRPRRSCRAHSRQIQLSSAALLSRHSTIFSLFPSL